MSVCVEAISSFSLKLKDGKMSSSNEQQRENISKIFLGLYVTNCAHSHLRNAACTSLYV